MLNDLQKIKKDITARLKAVKNEADLKQVELEFLSRKGKLPALLKKIATVEKSARKEVGKLANEIKKEIEDEVKAKRHGLTGDNAGEGVVDVTLPGKSIRRGTLHPITRIRDDLEELFLGLGFMVLDGPEVESEFYNFEALNIPAWHPARDMQDTFYIKGGKGRNKAVKGEKSDSSGLVMRTHTSPVQVRAMRKYGSPIRCVAPGRVYRAEATDAVHEHTFDQMEGLMVGPDISLANLIAVMKELLSGIFGYTPETRIRPGYFPFVEPGIELDIKCTICGGDKGCPGCKHSGWLELLPAGMVHPKVLEFGQIDPKENFGFAFGLGLTRLAMMKYGIDDIRLFNSGDMRFLGQF